MHLLALPYDVRHLIYSHIFPTGQQVYIQAFNGALRGITIEHHIPIQLLRTCKHLHAEAGEFFYNAYLFNIIGRKRDCLSTYDIFMRVATKHARDTVQLHAFSNGSHSTTMCLSIHIGDGKLALLRGRQRGEPKTISELQRELEKTESRLQDSRLYQMLYVIPTSQRLYFAAALCMAVIAAATALLIWV